MAKLSNGSKNGLMSAVFMAVAVAGGILLAGVVKKNFMKSSTTEEL